jgi:hypothetical protein
MNCVLRIASSSVKISGGDWANVPDLQMWDFVPDNLQRLDLMCPLLTMTLGEHSKHRRFVQN